jgi:uncharacterized membrane protein YkvI
MAELKTIVRLSGAYIAFLIGSGFATGQEILQFFAGFGLRSLLGCLLVLAGSAYLAVSFYLAGQRHDLRNSDEVFRHYAGPLLGPAFGWYTVVVAYSIYVVMLSGAGAVLHQHLGVPVELGAAAMGVVVFVTLYFGLHELVDVIGSIGPLLVILILVIAGVAVFGDPRRVLIADTVVGTVSILRAAPTWWLSALVYLSMLQPPLAAFLPPLGAATANPRTLAWAGVLGSLLFTVTLALCTLALLAGLPDIGGNVIPMLALATRVTPRVAAIFQWIIVAGIFTTAAPMLWITAVRLAPDGSPRYRVFVALLGAIGYAAGVALPFDRLLNLIYPTIGWSGFVLVVCVVWKQIRTRSIG